jgi:hypothetical protein
LYAVAAILGLLALFVTFLLTRDQSQEPQINIGSVSSSSLPSNSFALLRDTYPMQFPQGVRQVISPNQSLVTELDTLRSTFEYLVEIDNTGWYQLAIQVQDSSPNLLTNRISLRLNGESPYYETRSIALPAEWQMPRNDFPIDRYGNEVMPIALKQQGTREIILRDATSLTAEDFRFYLTAGSHTIEIAAIQGTFELQALVVQSVNLVPNYETTVQSFQESDIATTTLLIPAEDFRLKSNPSTRLIPISNPLATSYDTRQLQLSVIDGYSFRQGNDSVTFEIQVPQAGWYNISVDYRQQYLMQMPVFRELRINGELPFAQMQWVPFHYSNNFNLYTWVVTTLIGLFGCRYE